MKLQIFSFLILAAFAFSSCEKHKDFDKDGKEIKDGSKEDKKECFEMVYPLSYTMPDGSTETVDHEKDWDSLKAWYEDYPDAEEKPALQYPVETIWGDELKTIHNEEEMIIAKKACEKKGCFELVYPLTYTLPDGSEISGDDEKTLWTVIKAWYEDHPDAQEKPELKYPVDTKWEDGTDKTISSEDEMISAKKGCDSKEAEGG